MDPMLLGWAATVIFSLAIVPQIVKTVRVKHTDGVSPWLFVANMAANVIALVYATMISQPPLQIKYIIGILVSAAYLGIYLAYRTKTGRSDRRNE